jgi:hypothetical protein
VQRCFPFGAVAWPMCWLKSKIETEELDMEGNKVGVWACSKQSLLRQIIHGSNSGSSQVQNRGDEEINFKCEESRKKAETEEFIIKELTINDPSRKSSICDSIDFFWEWLDCELVQ